MRLDNLTFQYLRKSPLTSFELTINSRVNFTLETGIFDPFMYLCSFKIDSELEVLKSELDSLRSNLRDISLKIVSLNNKLTSSSLNHITRYRSTLQSLNILRSRISTIEDETFIEFSKLQRLIINHSILEILAPYAFSGLDHLEELYLKDNRLTSFPSSPLAKKSIRKSLRVLDLSYNRLTDVYVDDLLPSDLRDLILDFNPLSSVEKPLSLCAFHNVTSLTLSGIKGYNFRLTPCKKVFKLLRKLDLSWPANNNAMNYKCFFDDLSKITPYLKVLNLSGLSIESAPIIDMGNLTLLEHLQLEKCYTFLRDFPTMWGRHIQFSKLKWLNLAANRLTSITEMELSRTTPSIQVLILRNNRMQDIDENIFASLTKLEVLNLASNLFHRVDSLAQIKSLRRIDLSFNFVNEIPETFVRAIRSSNLEFLDLSGNPYFCSCAIQPFKKWILSDNRIYLKPNMMYICNGPSEFDGLSLTEINLDCKSKAPIYIGTGMCGGFLLCLVIVMVFRLRWHIRYKLFLLFKKRRYRRRVQEEDCIELNRLGYDAFVSYAHESNRDLNWVLDELRVNMEEGPDPITLCIGQSRDYVPGANLIEAITDAIHNSRKAIIVLSPNYVASEWCYFEVQQALAEITE